MNPQISITADEASQVQVVVQEIPEVLVVEWIQEQSAVTDLVNPQITVTAVEASLVVGSFPLLEDFAAPMYNQVHQEQIVATVQPQVIIVQEISQLPVVEWIQEQIVETIEVVPQEQIEDIPVPQEQLIAEVTTLNTSSTSTSSDRRLDEFTNMLDSCIALLTPMTAQVENIEKETERVAMLTKRMLEPPMMEPPKVMEPTLTESERGSSKRRRRTQYTPLPGIMENAVYLAPSAWPATRRA